MSTRLSDQPVITGLFISDPRAHDWDVIKSEMEEIRLLVDEKLQKRLDDTLEELDSHGPEKIGKFCTQGLIRGAYFACNLLRARSRSHLKSTESPAEIHLLKARVKACENLSDALSAHNLAPEGVRVSTFSHRPYRQVLEEICNFYTQERERQDAGNLLKITDGMKFTDKTPDANSKAAYLPI